MDIDDDDDDAEVLGGDYSRFASAVVFSADWTAETLVSQITRSNIAMNPRFQRRDAWDIGRKSRFIESLVLGLPIPQIVLAEERLGKGKYIVLDGKQRLLALLQFWGLGQGKKNGFALAGLAIRTDLAGKTRHELDGDPDLSNDLRALENQTIRTVVIRSWPDQDFLHELFLRFNTGSVKLSPQELRQALMPGHYSDYVDDRATRSKPLQDLLGLSEPDYRMRDVEILVRHLAFVFFRDAYPGRMKKFLDESSERLNGSWELVQHDVEQAVVEFEQGIESLMSVFGGRASVARKPGSPILNRAILDALAFHFRNPDVRKYAQEQAESVRAAYKLLFKDPRFVAAVERDTAAASATSYRFDRVKELFSSALE
jgi:hypothetical protein